MRNEPFKLLWLAGSCPSVFTRRHVTFGGGHLARVDVG